MPFFSRQNNMGLDLGSSLIKVCVSKRGGRKLVLSMPTPPGMVSKGVLQSSENMELVRQWLRVNQLTSYPVIATLPASTLVLRHIQIPRMRPKEAREAVEWEARRVLPFSLEEAQVDWLNQGVITSDEGEMQDILLVAVRDTVVDRYVNAIRETGLKLVALDIAPMALGRWLFRDIVGSSLVVDIGAETTQVHFFNGLALVFSRSLTIGGNAATRAIAANMAGSLEDAEEAKRRGDYQEYWLNNWLSELGRELQRSLEYYRSNYAKEDSDKFERVILSGGASLSKGVESLIEEITGLAPGYAEFASKDDRPRHHKILYNVALGASLWEV